MNTQVRRSEKKIRVFAQVRADPALQRRRGAAACGALLARTHKRRTKLAPACFDGFIEMVCGPPGLSSLCVCVCGRMCAPACVSSYIWMRVCVCMYACTYARVYVDTRRHPHMHTPIQTYRHTYVQPDIQTYMSVQARRITPPWRGDNPLTDSPCWLHKPSGMTARTENQFRKR